MEEKKTNYEDWLFKYNKGKDYEIYICNKLNKLPNIIAWRWPDTPEYILLDCGLIESQEETRIIRKKIIDGEKINPQMDTGIDIICKKNNNYIFIQCKDHTTTYMSISCLKSYFTKMDEYPNNKGYIYYTGGLCSTVKLYLKNNTINKNIILRKYPYKEKKEKYHEIKLRDYQIEALKNINEYYNNNNRGILSMACGTGKTIVMINYILKYKTVIVLSPLKQYAEQNRHRILKHSNKEYKTLLIDSDGERDIENIIEYINTYNDKNILISATFKSVDVINKVIHSLDDVIIVIDEFHNLSKNNVLNNKDEMYKLLNSNYKILFMSATPRVYEIENESYDMTEIFGDIIYSLSFSDAIKNKYISDYRLCLPEIDENNFELEEAIKKEVNIDDIDELMRLKCEYMYKNILYYGLKKMIVYLRSHTEIDEFIIAINKLNKYYNVFFNVIKITSEDNYVSRKNKIQIFEDNNMEIQIFASVKILDECIDIPSCDSVYITYETQTKIRTIQRISRSLRYMNNKYATVILWCKQYDNLYNVISSIKEYDPELREKIKIIDKKSSDIKTEKYKKNIEYTEKNKIQIDKIIIKIKEYKPLSWHDNLEKLKLYMIKNGYPKLNSENKDEIYLHKWLLNNMNKYDNHNLEYMNEFEIFIKEFKLKTNKEIWMEKFKEMHNFMLTHDREPLNIKDERNMYEWYNDNYNKYENINMKYKNEFTEMIKIKNQKWKLMFDKLISYYEKNNKLPNEKNKNDDIVLYIWYNQNYKLYMNNKIKDDKFINLMIKNNIKTNNDLDNECIDNSLKQSINNKECTELLLELRKKEFDKHDKKIHELYKIMIKLYENEPEKKKKMIETYNKLFKKKLM